MLHCEMLNFYKVVFALNSKSWCNNWIFLIIVIVYPKIKNKMAVLKIYTTYTDDKILIIQFLIWISNEFNIGNSVFMHNR